MPVQRCRQETTATEYNDWFVYLSKRREQEWNRSDQLHYYLAQLTAELVRCNVTDASTARSIKLEDFLLKFKAKESERELTPDEKKEKIKQQKRLFGGIFGAPVPNE